MTSNLQVKLQEFQEKVEYKFNNVELLQRALTTPRYGNENNLPNYEAFETIGDAVIKLIFTLKIFNEGIEDPGKITKKKAKIENDPTLGMIASKVFNLEDFIFATNYEFIENSGMLADVLEAISGAIFLDSNLNLKIVETKIVDKFYKKIKNFIKESPIFNKNQLLEFLQKKYRSNPKIVVDFVKTGADNKPNWKAYLKSILKDADNEELIEINKELESGTYRSKKDAENELYKRIFNYLRNESN